MNKIFSFLFLSLLISSCYRVEDKLEPKMSYSLDETHINSLKTPFKNLSDEEKKEDWSKEYIIAKAFAKDLDLYRAITNFKRAKILINKDNIYRVQEIDYKILLSYYLAKKPSDVIETFEKSTLECVDKSFEAYEDLLLILFESYKELKDEDKTEKILELLQETAPQIEKQIVLSTALIDADLKKIEFLANQNPSKDNLLTMIESYKMQKKSVATAQTLNAILPGAGYLYIGQKKSALTALLLNGLFIYSSYEFLSRGWTAAGVITLSFEAGWYFGGIYGAGEEAKFYNERIYEESNTPMMKKEKYFPAFMIKYGF